MSIMTLSPIGYTNWIDVVMATISDTPIKQGEYVGIEIISRKTEEPYREFHWVMNNKSFMIFQVKSYFKVLLLDVDDVSVFNYLDVQTAPHFL